MKRTLLICSDEDFDKISALKDKVMGDFDVVTANQADLIIKSERAVEPIKLMPIEPELTFYQPPLTRAKGRKQARKTK